MISNELKEITYSQESDIAVIILLTINTEDSDEKLYICNVPVEKFSDLGENIYGCVSNGNRFIFLPFEITLPQDDKTGAVSAKLTIDNVDRNIIPYIRSSIKPVNMKIQLVLSSNLDNIEVEYDNFKLKNVSYDGFKISGDVSIEYLELEPFPSGRFTPSGFPGLF